MARGAIQGPHRYQFELGKRNYNFSATVDKFIAETTKRMSALVRQSTSDMVDIMQTPKAKGGRMPVDTGFLRLSGQLSLTGMPSGPVRGEEGKTYVYDSAPITLTLANYKLGDTIYFGWTANYAIYREAYDGFLEAAVQQFPKIVDRVTLDIKARVAK